MIPVATRRTVRRMLAMGHSKAEIVRLTGISLSSVKRIAREPEPAPTGKKSPEFASHMTVSPGQLSVVVGAGNDTFAPHAPGSLSTTMSAGQTIVGSSVSFTVTVKAQLAVLPDASVAVQFTAVTPTCAASALV